MMFAKIINLSMWCDHPKFRAFFIEKSKGSRPVVPLYQDDEKLYTVGKNSFEFQRTVSRLFEMQSNDWPKREKTC